MIFRIEVIQDDIDYAKAELVPDPLSAAIMRKWDAKWAMVGWGYGKAILKDGTTLDLRGDARLMKKYLYKWDMEHKWELGQVFEIDVVNIVKKEFKPVPKNYKSRKYAKDIETRLSR